MVRRTVLGAAVVLLLMLCGECFAAKSAANAQTRAQLDRVLPVVNFSNVTLKDAIDFLRDVSGSNIHVNWKAIEAAGITPDTAINVKLRQVSLRKVLGLLLSEASGGVGLTFYIDDGVIEITTTEIADNTMYTVVYPVQDLLVEPPPFIEPPQFDLSYASSRGSAGGGRGGGGGGGGRGGGGGGGGGGSGGQGGLFGQSGQNYGQQNTPRDKDAKAKELVELITETVTPSIWVQNGGKATIRFFNGNLIVTAPRSVHEAIGGPVD
jgi:uncharacterized membrane protein YgcG